MNKLILIIFILSPLVCHADDVFVDAGIGAFRTAGDDAVGTKFLKLGVQEDLWEGFKQRFNGGFWLDSQGQGRSSSGFAGYQWGFEVDNDVFQSSVFAGPTLITSPDSYLGGIFQFNESLFFGIKDRFDNSIGMFYNHFSSAGIENPNKGRDFMGVEIKFGI